MSKKIKVIFEGGNATDGVHSCDYMLCNCYDRDGEPVRLYAEYLQPEDLAFGDLDGFDKEAYPLLKRKILEQAEENNVDPDTLAFQVF